VVCETQDAVALATRADVISIEIAQVLTDAEMAAVLS
jgi:hypothetical protein